MFATDPAVEARVDFADGSAIEHFFLGDICNTDGSPWECCPRDFLRRAVKELGDVASLRLVAAFEQEFLYTGVSDRPGDAYALGAFRRHRETVGALVEAAGYDPEVRRFWHGFHERFEHVAARRIAAGDPALDSAHARARAFALIWMTERSLTEHLAQPSADEAALLDELARFWQHASHP